ncbi:hypothetical protein [Streptomyces sp. NPDC001770]
MTTTSGPTVHPLVARLKEIEESERLGLEAADAALARAEQVVGDARLAQRVARERHAAVAATVEAAETFTETPDATDNDYQTHSEQTASSAGAPPTEPPEDSGESLTDVMLKVLETGREYSLAEVYVLLDAVRPGVTSSAVRAKFTVLKKRGRVRSPRRGVFVVLDVQEDHRPDS